MIRKEGIIKRAQSPENASVLAAAKGDLNKVLDTEYQNYLELCYYCNEEPKEKNQWLYERIKPAKK